MLNANRCFRGVKKRWFFAFLGLAATLIALALALFCSAGNDAYRSADAINTSKVSTRLIDGSSDSQRMISSNGTFNKSRVQVLLNTLAYGYDSINNRTASISDVSSQLTSGSSSSYYYMAPSTLRARGGSNASSVGLYLDGSLWHLVYLSKNGSNAPSSVGSNGDVIATFWRSDSKTSIAMHSTTTTVYAQSTARQNTIRNYRLISDSWDSQYIVKPQNVYWQYSQSSYWDYNRYNDGFSTDTSEQSTWKVDYQWLPSVAEVYGSSSTSASAGSQSGIWGLTSDEKGNSSTSSYYWLRSAVSKTNYARLKGDGSRGGASATGSNSIRPALHLNLTKVAAQLTTPVSVPQSLSVDYSGAAINLGNQSWFSSYYTNTSVMTVSPALSSIKNVKTYSNVQFTIAANNSSKCVWADNYTTGTRYATFTIKPKDLYITGFTYNESTGKVTGISTSGAAGSEIPPYGAFKYYYARKDGLPLVNPYAKPTETGEYYVYPEYDQTNTTYKSFYDNYNVIVQDSAKRSLSVSGIALPENVERIYTGSAIVISDTLWYQEDRAYYSNTSLMTITPALSTIKDVKEYDVTFTLKANSSNVVWKDTQKVGSKTVKFRILPKTLTVNSFTYDEDNQVVKTVSTTGQVPGQTPSPLAFRYYYADDGGGSIGITNRYVKPVVAGRYRVGIELDQSALDKNTALKNFYHNYDVQIGPSAYDDITVVGVPVPKDVTKAYTSYVADISRENWYSYELYSKYVEYSLARCKDVDSYIITFTLINPTLIRWEDGTTAAKEITLTVSPRPLWATLSWGEDEMPHEELGGVKGDPASGLIEGESVLVRYRYTYVDGVTLVNPSNPYIRPGKKGRYRAYIEVDPRITPVNYMIANKAYIEFDLEGVAVPQDIHTTYTGNPLVLSGETWFNERYYGPDGYIEYNADELRSFIDCPKAKGREFYQMDFHMKSGADLDWSDGRTERTVSIKIYIAPKPIEVQYIQNVETNALSLVPYEGEICTRDLYNPPIFENYYYKFDMDNDVDIPIEDPLHEPTERGLYHVYPVIREERGGENVNNYNYVIKLKEYCFMYAVLSEVIKTPSTEQNLTQTYTGDPISFKIDPDTLRVMGKGEKAKIAEYEHPNEIKRQGIDYDPEEHTFTVKNAGVYVIQFHLTSEEIMWDTKGGYMTITIEKRAVSIENFTGLETVPGLELTANMDIPVRFNHKDVAEDDWKGITFQLTYQHENNVPVSLIMDRGVIKHEDPEPDEYTKEVGKTLNFNKTGNFTITIELASANAYPTNKNYVFTDESPRTITLAGRKIEVSDSDLVWKYKNSLCKTSAFDSDKTVEYNTREYTVFVDQDALRKLGLKVKLYANTSATYANKKDEFYTSYVTLTAYDSSWIYEEEEEGLDTTFQLDWTISQGVFNLTSVMWDYSAPYPYTGAEQWVSLQNLYGGLVANLQGEYKATKVGKHTAGVLFQSGDPNYRHPDPKDDTSYRYEAEGDFPWFIDWEIVATEVIPQWNMHGKTLENKEHAYVTHPTLFGLPEDAVRYTFFDASDKVLANGAEDLLIVDSKETGYYIQAEIIAGAPKNYDKMYTLVDANNHLYFTVGQDKTPIKIVYEDVDKYYTGKALPFDFSIELADPKDFGKVDVPTKGNFVVTFYEGNQLVGTDSRVPMDIGVYEVRFEFKDNATINEFYIQGKTSFTYTVERAKLNFSELHWTYNPQKPFVYELEADGSPKTYSVKLEGINENAYTLIYEINDKETIPVRSEASEVGVYVSRFKIISLDEIRYEPVYLNQFPEELRTCEWEITTYTIDVPEPNAQIAFDGGVHKLWQLLGLPETYERYMTVTITYNDQLTDSTDVLDAGDYRMECILLPILVARGRIRWSEGGATSLKIGRLTVNPLTIKINGWRVRTGQSPVPTFVEDPESSLYEMEYYFDGERIGENEIKKYFGEKITAVVVPSSDYKEGDVVISATSDTDVSYDFYLFSKEARAITKPYFANEKLLYNGRMQQFNLVGFNSMYMEYVGDSRMQRKELGSGYVTVRLKVSQNVKWDDDTTADLILPYEIICGKITATWDLTGIPFLTVPDEFLDAIDYIFIDANNESIAAESLEYGNKYTVIAKINSEFENYLTIDDKTEISTSFTYHSPDDILYDIPELIELVELPMWQIVVGGVSIVLTAVFTFLTSVYATSAKKAEEKRKKLASMPLSVAPFLPLLTIYSWLGMGETFWTAISLSLVGVMLVMLATMLIFREKSIRAIAKYDAEQLRYDAMKAAKDEQKRKDEDLRHDAEVRMMFANMQNNYANAASNMQNMLSGNMQQLIEGTVNAMLPPAENTQQALPSGYAEMREVIAKQESMLKVLMDAQEQDFAAQEKSYEELCKLMESIPKEQKEGEDNSDEFEELKRVITRQESMIGDLMNARRLREKSAASIDGDEETEEKNTLEEALNKLEEEAKGMFDEIREFIKEKENMELVEGKFALLFKYRGKSLFKLNVKENAPYFSYVLDNGSQAEICVEDEISVDEIKQTVSMRMKRVDRDLEEAEK